MSGERLKGHGSGDSRSAVENRRQRKMRETVARDAAEAKRKRRRVRNARNAVFGGYR